MIAAGRHGHDAWPALPTHRRMRLRAIGLAGAGIAALLLTSLLAMQVAAARDRLATIDRRVAATRRDYALLVTEFEIRSRPAQQLSWSETGLALAPPRTDQYLARLGDLRALARPVPSPRAYAAR